MKQPWSGTYSVNGNHYYPYADPDEFPLVVLCDECSAEELRANHIGMLLY